MDFNQGVAIARGIGLIYKKFYSEKNDKPIASTINIPKSKPEFDKSMISDALNTNQSSNTNGLLIAGSIFLIGLCLLDKPSKK